MDLARKARRPEEMRSQARPPGRSGEMEDACAVVPRFADIYVHLLARRRDLDCLGLNADALRLSSHLFDGHGDA